MARSQLKSKRKPSGGRYHASRTKRRRELGNLPTLTKLSEKKVKDRRTQGGHIKQVLLSVQEINVTNNQGKTQKTKILGVVENPANPNLVRRSIITKGAIVETELGKARVTSRPGHEGSLHGILI